LQELYVADLNAIDGHDLQGNLVRSICALGPPVLIDAGVRTTGDVPRVAETGAQALVVGLETLSSFETLDEICRNSGPTVAFSLDLRNGVPVTGGDSPEDIACRAAHAGVHTIIVLDLARVGSSAGPDIDMMRRIRAAAPDVSLLAGGGVRSLTDLRQIADVGGDGVLAATALHAGRLTAADIAAAALL
jgi:phosphoribosylformimino-5-aminoimidazole carboxamide ribotide isomerase